MADREKLIELLNTHCDYAGHVDCKEDCAGCLADHLIANGVTFATDTNDGGKWVPVSERLPEEYEMVLTYLPERRTKMNIREGWLTRYGFWESSTGKRNPGEVTHWMSLPGAPKED